MVRKIFITLSIITIFISNVQAKTDFPKVIDAYIFNLNSKSKGVIESSLMYISKLSMENPDVDFHKVLKNLDKLMKDESSKSLQYKVYLTRLIITSPCLHLDYPSSIVDPSDFFHTISEQLFREIDITTK